jgi:mannosyltransferase
MSAEDAGAGRRGAIRWPIYAPIVVLVALAVTVRVAWITHQSLWFDEVVSLTLAKQPFDSMLRGVARTESTPPLYYAVLWVWVRIFGTTALALRSASALIGVGTVVVIYLTGRIRFSRGAAFVAGALAATDPMMIWYSQETRAYALVTLFLAGTLYYFVRSRARQCEHAPVGWGILAGLALATHYFAAFVVIPEALILIYGYRRRLRTLLPALAIPAVTGVLLLPLALHQRGAGHTNFIAGLSLRARIQQPLNEYLLGTYSISTSHLALAWLVIAVLAIVSIRRRARGGEQHEAFLMVAIAAAAFLLPLLVASSAFFHRNLIVVLPPLVLAAGVAFAPRHASRRWVVAGTCFALLLIAPTVLIVKRPTLERENWRAIARQIGPEAPGTAVLAYPRFEYIPLVHYRPSLHVVDHGTVGVSSLVVVGRPQLTTLKLPRGFHRVSTTSLGNLRIVRFRSSKVRALDVAGLHLRPVLRLLKATPERDHGQDATLLR